MTASGSYWEIERVGLQDCPWFYLPQTMEEQMDWLQTMLPDSIPEKQACHLFPPSSRSVLHKSSRPLSFVDSQSFLYIAHGSPSAENAYHELRGLFAYALTPKSMAEKVQHFNSDHYSCFFSHRTPGLTSSSSRPRPPRAAGPGCYTASSPSSQLRDIVASFSSYD